MTCSLYTDVPLLAIPPEAAEAAPHEVREGGAPPARHLTPTDTLLNPVTTRIKGREGGEKPHTTQSADQKKCAPPNTSDGGFLIFHAPLVPQGVLQPSRERERESWRNAFISLSVSAVEKYYRVLPLAQRTAVELTQKVAAQSALAFLVALAVAAPRVV